MRELEISLPSTALGSADVTYVMSTVTFHAHQDCVSQADPLHARKMIPDFRWSGQALTNDLFHTCQMLIPHLGMYHSQHRD